MSRRPVDRPVDVKVRARLFQLLMANGVPAKDIAAALGWHVSRVYRARHDHEIEVYVQPEKFPDCPRCKEIR